MDDLARKDLDRLLELHGEAIRGPWRWTWPPATSEDDYVIGPDGLPVCWMYRSDAHDENDWPQGRYQAALIAEYRSAVPLLIALVESLARDVVVANECIGSDRQAVRRARSLLPEEQSDGSK